VLSGRSFLKFRRNALLPRSRLKLPIQEANRNLCFAYSSTLLATGCLAYSSTLKMEALRSSETWVNFYQTTRRHMSKNGTLHSISYRSIRAKRRIPVRTSKYYHFTDRTDPVSETLSFFHSARRWTKSRTLSNPDSSVPKGF
jgi:hypothetical protein